MLIIYVDGLKSMTLVPFLVVTVGVSLMGLKS